MALHNTQCPHCFTTYVISDEQIRVSEGMVRCGTCGERFQARVIDLDASAPRFDPRETFIEPLTEEREAERERAELQAIEDEKAREKNERRQQAQREEDARQAEIEKSRLEVLSRQKTSAIDFDFDSSALKVDKLLANIKAKEQREIEQAEQNAAFEAAASDVDFNQAALEADEQAKHREFEESFTLVGYGARSNKDENHQKELALDADNTTPADAQKKEAESDKETLIEQVDALVDDKLVNKEVEENGDETHEPRAGISNTEPFQLDKKSAKPASKGSLLGSFIKAIVLLTLMLALAAVFIYQLWLRQVIVLDKKSALHNVASEKISLIAKPLVEKLYEQGIQLPVRRNLASLELASATTDAHPTRASTTLLRISIINHAEIQQPLPWLEMSLTDSDGKLVSRRSLSPRDYVYQNATDNLIGARELKKVTIELLSFPKQATGYELKILDK